MKTPPPDFTLPPDDAPMASRSDRKRKFYLPANITAEQQWKHETGKQGKGNGTFVALLLLHLLGVGGLIAFNYLGKDAGQKKNDPPAGTTPSTETPPKARIVDAGAAPQPRAVSLPKNYRVQPGDSWAGLAAVRGLTESQLHAANPGLETLFVGQSIHLPDSPHIITEATPPKAVVPPKAKQVIDTTDIPLGQSGRKFALNDATDPLANLPVPGLPSGNRRPQQTAPIQPQDPPQLPDPAPALDPPTLPLPTPEATAPIPNQGYGSPQQATGKPAKKTYIIHDVVKGDTVFSLAKKYKMTVDDFMALNELRNNSIRIGQTLKARTGAAE